ncbi:hypothetical protein SLA2020_267080 [Shorea laevis]
MVNCTRCFLHRSMRVVNLIVNICGIGMIIYSLWLLKKWQDGVAELPPVSLVPRPWFIYTCLAVGIAISLSSLSGHMVANCISNYTLCIYTVSIFSLLLIEVAVIVTIFFRMDWERQIVKYIDEHHIKFKIFVIFHIKMCRFILIIILVPQADLEVLEAVLDGGTPHIVVLSGGAAKSMSELEPSVCGYGNGGSMLGFSVGQKRWFGVGVEDGKNLFHGSCVVACLFCVVSWWLW